VICIINLVGRSSNYRLVRSQKMSEIGKNKLISCDGWADSYQERNALKPHCRGAITKACCGELLLGAKGHGRDSAITPKEEQQL